jgi:ubiquitin C-terminal hydrolase
MFNSSGKPSSQEVQAGLKLPVAMETVTPPGGSMSSKQCLFQHTRLNVGNACYFNSVLQVVASLPLFVLAIKNTPHNQDHADSFLLSSILEALHPGDCISDLVAHQRA